MLSKEQNERMCRVGPDTDMGAAMRRYWLPALLTSELPEPDGAPVHVELLGEHFVVFRDTNGDIGFMDEFCCHRGASLLMGRVEECGIRCLYHGWKFAVDGTVMETPNVADPKFKERFKARAYPVKEAGGLVWVYLGPKDKQPQFPDWLWFDLPESNRLNTCHVVNCNYVQLMEGLLDSSHLNILHTSAMNISSTDSGLSYSQQVARMKVDSAPRLEAEETQFGLHYVALRKIPEGEENSGQTLAKIAAFVPPCFNCNPNGDVTLAVVPVNDHRSRFYHIWWDPELKYGEEPLRSQQLEFVGLDEKTLKKCGVTADTCDTPAAPQRANRFLQDRDAMENHFTGLPSLIHEDVAIAVSGGAIRDRSREMLLMPDKAISLLYRVLLKCAEKVKRGEDPIGLDTKLDYKNIVGKTAYISNPENWRELTPGHIPIEQEKHKNKETVEPEELTS